MATLFFFYFASVIVLTAVLVVALRNPVYSTISLLIMFFHVAGLFVILHAEFLAAVQVIVYAGAILVLYLFVVMLLNVKRDERYHAQFPIAALLGLTIVTEVLLLAFRESFASQLAPSSLPATQAVFGAGGVVEAGDAPAVTGNTETIGEVLYSTYLFPFEVASLILLVAMIGAILLTKKGLFQAER